MKTVKELQELLNAKRAELAAIFEKAKTKVDGEDRYNLTPVQLEDVKARNAEIDGIAKELEDAKLVDSVYQANAKAIRDGNRAASDLPLGSGQVGGQPKQAKSLGQLFVESEAYKGRERKRDINAIFPDFDFLAFKTLMETGAGFAPESMRTGKIVEYAHRRPVVADLIPQTPTDQAAIVYMEETTFTNAAATRAEGGQAGESALAFTERSETIREIATWLPVTEIQIEDVSVVQALINNRLLTMLDLTEEVQLMTGSGVAPNMTGFLIKSGVQSQAKGADPTPDAIYKAMTLVRHTGFAEPSAIAIHPNDWQDIRLLRTTDGIYIWGSPAEAGAERIWGLPAVITTAETENTALLGDFQLYSEIFRKRGANIKVSDSHSDYFIKGKLAIRADKRLTLAIYRAAAFCKVTGI
uniref:Putative capsid protein n=1 Tax=viral metagenome TaxID=1070528 RepID=A0A6H1ZE93_9ZZZZ